MNTALNTKKRSMRNIKFIISTIVVLSIISSCTIKGSFRGLYSYYKTTNRESPDLLRKAKPDSVCYYTNENGNSKVIIVTGLDIKKCISKSKEALVYIWRPNCSSQICLPLEIVQNYCNSKNIDLFIVAEYYDSKKMQIKWNIKRPIYGIDTKYYRTSLTKKYLERFLKDLEIKTISEDTYLYFKNGEFSKSGESIYDI